MECLLCGGNYINLGVHLRHKHHADPDDYRNEFCLMKTTALVDKELSDRMRKSAKARMLDPNYKSTMQSICLENARKNIWVTPSEMSIAGKEKLSKRNKEAHSKRLYKLAPVVNKILTEKRTIVDVRREIGMGRDAVMKIVSKGLAAYDKKSALIIGTKRRVESRMKNRNENQES